MKVPGRRGVQCPLSAGASIRLHRASPISQFRPAEARDFEIVRRLAISASELPEAAAGSTERLRFMGEARGRFERSLADPQEFWRVAEVAGAVVAWIHAGIRDDGAMRGPDFMEVVMIYVAEPHRRHGLARGLMELVEHLARDSGITALRLVVHASNTGAIAMYLGLGFLAGQGMMEKRL